MYTVCGKRYFQDCRESGCAQRLHVPDEAAEMERGASVSAHSRVPQCKEGVNEVF